LAAAFICDATRTPFGRYGGALSRIRVDDLAALPLRALLARNPSLDPSLFDEVVLGCANQSGEDNRNVARMASLLAGLPISVPAYTVNRLCASGLEACAQAARMIALGEAGLVFAGGVEGMSRAPYVMAKAGEPLSRTQQLEDTTLGWRMVNPLMRARFGVDSMAQTAENLAAEMGIERADQDAFALRSQQRAARAVADGRFADEITPVAAAEAKTDADIAADEQPRPDTALEKLAALKPIVSPEGTVTAGNASGLNDGACALLIASEAAVAAHGLTPLARILGAASAGVAPRTMGLGPVPAIGKLLERLRLSLEDFDRIEINEAFAAQVLACTRTLGLADDDARLNPHGGAIALGHPLGASGARLLASCALALASDGHRRALVSLCVGVGQGLALAVERP
jgi:3-oxoadipyl-CoA thiolase